MEFLRGLLLGLVVYSATAFPFAALARPEGDHWAAIFMLYGTACGILAMAWTMSR